MNRLFWMSTILLTLLSFTGTEHGLTPVSTVDHHNISIDASTHQNHPAPANTSHPELICTEFEDNCLPSLKKIRTPSFFCLFIPLQPETSFHVPQQRFLQMSLNTKLTGINQPAMSTVLRC